MAAHKVQLDVIECSYIDSSVNKTKGFQKKRNKIFCYGKNNSVTVGGKFLLLQKKIQVGCHWITLISASPLLLFHFSWRSLWNWSLTKGNIIFLLMHLGCPCQQKKKKKKEGDSLDYLDDILEIENTHQVSLPVCQMIGAVSDL